MGAMAGAAFGVCVDGCTPACGGTATAGRTARAAGATTGARCTPGLAGLGVALAAGVCGAGGADASCARASPPHASVKMTSADAKPRALLRDEHCAIV
jgi:hypothetical protein